LHVTFLPARGFNVLPHSFFRSKLVTVTNSTHPFENPHFSYQELIQNAEDAGATHAKFLHDKNSYGKAQLYDKKLEKFQVKERLHITSNFLA